MIVEYQKQVIKIGSDVTLDDLGRVNVEQLRRLAEEFKQLEIEHNLLSTLVFSGYVKAGKILNADKRYTKDIPLVDLEHHVRTGREIVLEGIGKAFEGIYSVEERLFTYDDLYLNEEHHAQLQNYIVTDYVENWKKGILLATNYDDLRDKSEIRKDNDKFAAYIAVTLGAKRLIILGKKYTGFYKDHNDSNTLIKKINGIKEEHFRCCNGSSANGVGGFATKLEAGEIGEQYGFDVIVGNINTKLMDLIRGDTGSYLAGDYR